MESHRVREAFLNFFASKGHTIVPSAPMVIHNDPTLMFTNAGMNQFKGIFLGHQSASYSRVADSQKCLRVSGKQNDLEEVGHDTYHHTMFEMLGNWSFGDYFKAEAIEWAWEFLTGTLGIDSDRLYVTIFEGNSEYGLKRDNEAYDAWAKWVPKERILDGSMKDNFWEMGETGPCGPCSEIHIDLRGEAERTKVPGDQLVNRDHPEVIEIWNLVFMQFNRCADGQLVPLPAQHVDTGMGFERLCMVLQGKKSTYDTDIFQSLMSHYADRAGCRYGAEPQTDVALRVVADHLRAVAFAIADGQLPSNNRAGYVIRRILRRAVRYGYSFLGFRKPFLHSGLPALQQVMGPYYPELELQDELIHRVILEEERAFFRTLEAGLQLLEEKIRTLTQQGISTLDGESAFILLDRFGFPLDLTQLMAREKGLAVDLDGFNEAMAQQKERSRSAAKLEHGDWISIHESETPEQPLPHFVGYDQLGATVRIRKMRTVKAKKGNTYQIVLDTTPFYAESGGQIGDRGTLTSPKETIQVLTTIKENNLSLIVTDRLPEDPYAPFVASVDQAARIGAMQHHTATHLLHQALRENLGTHVQQRGSLVEPDRLRFDFSHFERLTEEQVRSIEARVNELIRMALPRKEHRDLPIEEAQSLGAIALFGEKYGDRVRVLEFGESVEFCGGTHVENTGSIGAFKIISEGGISAGVRRIEAVAGQAAEQLLYQLWDLKESINARLNAQGHPLQAVERLQQERDQLLQEKQQARRERIARLAHDLLAKAKPTARDSVRLIAERTDGLTPDDLKGLAQDLRNRADDLVIILGAVSAEGTPSLVVAGSDAAVERTGLNAGSVIRAAAPEIRGGGGGQPFLAQAGGKDPKGIDKAILKAIQECGITTP